MVDVALDAPLPPPAEAPIVEAAFEQPAADAPPPPAPPAEDVNLAAANPDWDAADAPAEGPVWALHTAPLAQDPVLPAPAPAPGAPGSAGRTAAAC